MDWIKLNFSYLGKSKKAHDIFRAKRWNRKYENILKNTVYNEKYEKIGVIQEIFGPIQMPFISIKSSKQLDPNMMLYVKVS
jgi:rRNA processing protein Gar1